MHPVLAAEKAGIPIHFVTTETFATTALDPVAAAFAKAQGFEGASGSHLLVPDSSGKLAGVLFGLEKSSIPSRDPFLVGKLAPLLPEGIYKFGSGLENPELATLGFVLGSYRFERYKSKPRGIKARLCVPDGVDASRITRITEAIAEGRDLINTPANDLGPAEIEAAVRTVATRYGAQCSSIIGDDLITHNFPMIHAVGRASPRAPRIIDLVWGDPSHPKVTLVGKGVAFDTGGLNIKPDSSMLLMKKDMGGAAVALAAARMVMDSGLKVRLRLIVAAVENSISGPSFRPGDILASRNGMTVEIGNTDAEGRLILGDALTLAGEDNPDLVLDFATLTGAARVAVGPDLPPFYTDDETLAADISRIGTAVNDPVWRLPLWKPYAAMLESKIADVNHISSGPFAGSITAALFLQKFAEKAKAWAHFDVFCWVPSAKSGRPEGGDPQTARMVYALLEHRYGG